MPQFLIGAGAARCLGALERRMPRTATPRADRPAVESSGAAAGAQIATDPRLQTIYPMPTWQSGRVLQITWKSVAVSARPGLRMANSIAAPAPEPSASKKICPVALL
jgi:hypothetical protein